MEDARPQAGSMVPQAASMVPEAESMLPLAVAMVPQAVSIPPQAGSTVLDADSAPLPADSMLSRLLSGIEAGIIGGLAMLAILAVSALERNHVWWETPNLLGSTFYGTRAFRSGLGAPTLAGAAFELVICGLVGSVFGLLFGGMRSRRLLLPLGAAFGVAWYYAADALFWSQVNPLVPAYSFAPAVIFSHVLFGTCLGFMGRNLEDTPEPLASVKFPEAQPMPDELE